MSLGLKKLQMFDIILASRSQRRQMLLSGLDIDFQVIVKSTKEEYPPEMTIEEIPEYLSKIKANAVNINSKSDNTIIITADTVVVLDNKLIEKPKSKSEAREMLQRLSGRCHTVITGVSLTSKKKQKSFSSFSKVYFRQLEDDEIQYYVDKYNPLDKAGSYGIQEWIGYIAIEKIEGSFYNVMGLPTQQLYEHLLNFVE